MVMMHQIIAVVKDNLEMESVVKGRVTVTMMMVVLLDCCVAQITVLLICHQHITAATDQVKSQSQYNTTIDNAFSCLSTKMWGCKSWSF